MTLLDASPAAVAERQSWLRAATAAGALLLLAAGIPVLLALLIGWPFPHQVPTGGQLKHAVTAPVSGRAVIDVLACLAWLAWGHLLGGVVVEFVVQLRGAQYPRRWPRRLPTQAVAYRLVSGLLLALPTAPLVGHALPAAAVTPASATVDRTFTTAPAYPHDPHSNSSSLRPVVEAPESQPVTASPHRPTHRSLKRYVVAQPHEGRHDSLWDIAQRHLGDPLRYREIYQLNKGRPQPDGGELTEASLIRPGWVLLLPADAHGPGVEPVGDARTPDHPAAPAAQPSAASAHPPDAVNDITTPPAPASPTGPTAVPEQPTPPRLERPVTAPPDVSSRRPQHGTRLPLDLGVGVAALAALAALERARRIAQRRRPLRRRVSPVPPDLRTVEAELRRQARHAEPAAAAVRLAAALTVSARPAPQISAAFVRSDGTVELSLDTPRTPVPPFVGEAQRWRLPVGGTAYGFAADDHIDPCPALVPVGRDADDSEVSVNLEPAGVTVIQGEMPHGEALAAKIAASLLGAPWASPPVQVYAPAHLAEQLGPLEHLHALPAPGADLAAVRQQANVVRQECSVAGVSSLPELRRNGGANITSLLAFVGWRGEQIPEELIDLAADPATPVFIVAVGDHPRATERWQLSGTTLRIPSVDSPLSVTGSELPTGTGALLRHTLESPAEVAEDDGGAELRADAPPQRDAKDIEIRVLGPVDIIGVETPRRTPVLAMLIYLALHRRGVDAETLATALWPDKVVAGKTLRNRISEARTLVDNAITDGPGWKLDESIGCDWQRFQALAAGDIDAKRAALELVRGRPFQGLLDGDWADLEGFRTEIESAIVDVAVEVAEHGLSVNDPAAAFAAARTGLNASPYEERLYRLAMRAADAEGSTGKVRNLMRELQTVLDIEVEPDDEMQQETIETYRELVNKSLQRAAPT